MIRKMKSRKRIKLVIIVARRCKLHGLELAGYERLGYLSDGY